MERNVAKDIRDLEYRIRRYVSNDFDPNIMFNITQFRIVNYLLRHADEDVCQKDLEKETNLKKASITGSLDSLVEKGVVVRIQSTEDRRKNYIKLTESSDKFYKEFEERIVKLNNLIEERNSKADIDTFYRVMNSIDEIIGEQSK